MLISREVIERARQRDEQTEVLTEVRTRFQGPQYVLPLTMALLTSYTANARYAEPAFGRLTTRAISGNALDHSVIGTGNSGRLPLRVDHGMYKPASPLQTHLQRNCDTLNTVISRPSEAREDTASTQKQVSIRNSCRIRPVEG